MRVPEIDISGLPGKRLDTRQDVAHSSCAGRHASRVFVNAQHVVWGITSSSQGCWINVQFARGVQVPSVCKPPRWLDPGMIPTFVP
jgi:hypothetical protein